MKISEGIMTRLCLFGVALAAVMLIASGCEWTSSGSEGSWNESMSWVNFTGYYRSAGGRPLVGNFTTTSSTIGGGAPGQGGTVNGADLEYAVSNQQGPIQPAPFTVFSGTINYANRGTPGWRLKPGSVRITIRGTSTGPVGSFSDTGTDIRTQVNGPLAGTYSQVPGGPHFPGSGSVNYDTGAWSISLSSSDPFMQDAQISYSYVILQVGGAGGTAPDPGNGGNGGSGLQIVGGPVNTLQVEQTGNKLIFRTSSGYTLEGFLSVVTLPGGDSTGRSGGDVSATYEVKGDVGGQPVTISGTFSGAYVPPADIQFVQQNAPVIYGQMSNRIIQGIWMQPGGTADVYGVAPQLSVPVNVGSTPVVVPETPE